MWKNLKTKCQSLAILGIISFAGACSQTSPSEKIPTEGIILQNVTAIDAINGVRPHVDVAIIDDKIVSIKPRGSRQRLYTTTIDASGQYLIPGLWDAHVHLTYTSGLDHTTFFPLSLAHGVTSLRDTGGHIGLLADARKISKENPESPTLYFSGPLIDGANRIYDGSTPQKPDLSVGAGSPSEAEQIVDKLAASGVTLIKAYEMLEPDVFEAIVDRAEHHGLRVAAHTPLSMTTYDAIKAGAKDMQHLRNIEFDCAANADQLHRTKLELLAANGSPTPGDLRSAVHTQIRALALANQDDAACAAVIDALADAQVFQTPTLNISRFMTRKLFADDSYRQSFKLLPPALAKSWEERTSKYVSIDAGADAIDFDIWIMQMIPKLQAAGVPLMAGTDAPIGYLTPGASLHEEIFEFVKAGLTPLEALATATYTPAKFMGIEDHVGLISEGMTADLVLLRENPIEDITNIASIEAVVTRGNLLTRPDLDRLMLTPSNLSE